MRVYASVDDVRLPLAGMAGLARRAEQLGFDGLVVPEAVHDGMLAALLALEHSERLHVVTGVVVAFARSPTLLAQGAWDLAQLSGGRFTLGLGPQVRGNVEGRFGMPWSPPAARMRDYVGALRAVFDCWQRGTPLHYESESYRLSRMQPFFRPEPLPQGCRIPIALGAVGPRMLAVAGEVADVVIAHPTHSSPAYLREAMRPRLADGARRAGRAPEALEIVANPMVASGVDAEAVARERAAAREVLAFTFSTPAYRPALIHHGWEPLGEALRQRAREGAWSAMAPLLDDAVLDVLVPSAPFARVAEEILRRYAGVADGIALRMPKNPAQDAVFRPVVDALRAG